MAVKTLIVTKPHNFLRVAWWCAILPCCRELREDHVLEWAKKVPLI